MIYTFKNNDTGEVFEKHMRMADQKPYLEENPNLSLVITPSKIVGGYKSTISQTPDGFNDVLKNIKKGSDPKHCTIDTK
tara:strand:- start:629 stop:865 length:237 start_codon:yes stop_codon:yes gene_type:complete